MSGGSHGGGHGAVRGAAHGTSAKKSIDDYVKKDGIPFEEAYDKWHTFQDQDMGEMAANTAEPALNKFYDTFSSKLDALGIGAHDKGLAKHEDKIRDALTDALLEYHTISSPQAVEHAKTIKDKKAKYRFLVQQYDEHTGAGQIKGVGSVGDLLEAIKKDSTTITNLKNMYINQKSKHREGIGTVVGSKKFDQYFGHINKTDLLGHIKGKLPEYKLEVADEGTFHLLAKQDLIQLYGGLKHNKWGDKDHEDYGLQRPKAGGHGGGGHH